MVDLASEYPAHASDGLVDLPSKDPARPSDTSGSPVQEEPGMTGTTGGGGDGVKVKREWDEDVTSEGGAEKQASEAAFAE